MMMTSNKKWTWNIINEELKECNTWQSITNSKVWQAGFSGTVAENVFNSMTDDDTRFKIWQIMCAIATKYHLDIFYHNSSNKIAVGRKDYNKSRAETTPFSIKSSTFHKGDNKNDASGNKVLNGEIEFEQIADSISLQNWLEDKNSDFPKDLSVINTRPTKTIYLPSDFGNNTNEGDSQETDTSNSITNLPQHPLNVIFYGPPGTGKTYTTIERAMHICEGSDFDDKISRQDLVEQYQEYIEDERIVFTTFHQSYSYEDFIEGIRATTENNTINYKVQDGVFKELCKNAAQSPDENFVIIIDEINRGNISRVFGELITLIEDSKRTGKLEEISVKLPYSRESFSVPQNVYIIGTMNTADRSLAGLDLALRRRFTFEEMRPKTELLKGIKIEGIKIDELLSIMNQRIEVLLDREHTIGHAYFMELKNDSPIEKLAEIFQNKILPLLQEYFFDDWSKINSVLGENGFISKKDGDKALFKVKDSIDEKTIWQINTGAFAEKQKYIDIYQMA
ncbi:MAG TPA: AAA family ATPase [Agitococcus sp.]|nr:AAA family ATPase [Agitococcus sp.]